MCNRIFSVYFINFCEFLIIILIYSTQQIQCQVTKCCPVDFVFSTQNGYSCESPANRTFWDAYNIPLSSMPICTDSRNVFEGNETYIELNGCLDRNSNNQFVAVTCSKKTVESVHLMNKCCPIGQSYDHTGRFCTNDSNSHVQFKHLFGKTVVVFKNTVPDCSEEDVFVEYFSTDHNIQFLGKNLKVNDNILSPDKFCIEDLVNVDPSETKDSGQHFIVRSCRPRVVCNEIACIRRCCKADEIMEPRPKGKRQCQPHPNRTNLIPIFHDISLPLSDTQKQTRVKDYGVLQSWKCRKTFKLNQYDPDDLHYLNTNGMLYVIDQEPYDQENYCVENILTPSGSTEAHTFLCFDEENYDELIKFNYYPYGLSVSCVFLSITLVVYLSVPKLLNMRGRTLVCYIISLLAAYSTLAIIQFNKQNRSDLCHLAGFFLLYCLVASFCWQTLMCFDIWLTFGSLRYSFVMRHHKHNNRKFMYYLAYGWGVPFIWTLFTLFVGIFTLLPIEWNPILENACFFDYGINWKNHFLFFLLPVGFHVIINCILFVMTAINCNRVKRDIHQLSCIGDESNISMKRKNFIISRTIFIMNLKLFTVMGISWVLEIISTFSTNPTVEIILDMYNIFLGVFIFIIFVFKRKVFYELKCRFGIKPKNTGTVTPGSTSTSNNDICMKELAQAPDKSELL